jgi:hypothetical protein
LGLFSVVPGGISALGAGFTPFVNKLWRVEPSAANHDGGQLTTTYRDNIGDEGVDAALRRAVGTKYTKSGDSAWLFNAGDLSISEPSPITGKIGHPVVVLQSRSERSVAWLRRI